MEAEPMAEETQYVFTSCVDDKDQEEASEEEEEVAVHLYFRLFRIFLSVSLISSRLIATEMQQPRKAPATMEIGMIMR